MIFKSGTLLTLSAFLHLILGQPVRQQQRMLPQIDPLNSLEINNIGYQKPIRNITNFVKSMNYLDKTVKEVESILQANSSLPRLTRGEILHIIENITKSDLAQKQNKARDPKALMLVLPYTPDTVDESKIQEFYTRPPVTKIVGDLPDKTTPKTINRRRRPIEITANDEIAKAPIKNSVDYTIEKKSAKPETTTKHPETTTQTRVSFFITPTESQKLPRRPLTIGLPTPEDHSFRYEYSSTEAIESQRRRRPTKSPQHHVNHKYPEVSLNAFSQQDWKVSEPARLIPHQGRPFELTTRREYKVESTKGQPIFLPTIPTSPPQRPTTTTKPIFSEMNLPTKLFITLDDLNLGDSLSQYPETRLPIPITNANPPRADDQYKNILSSFGVFDTTSSTTRMPDISNVADTLSPDMKELLSSFGLLPDSNSKFTEINDAQTPGGSITSEINPESYIKFKPLPDNGATGYEMEEFLGRFGLGRSAKQHRKQFEEPAEYFAEDLVRDDDLSGFRINSRSGKKLVNSFDNVEKTDTQHVFNPMTTPNTTQDELEKLNQLLDIIKQLERLNGTATEEDLNKVDLNNLKQLVGSLNNDQSVPLNEQLVGPNPLNYDYGLAKNEVKRQESVTSTITSTTETALTITPETTVTTTTVQPTTLVEAETPNIKDLEDSFGGAANIASDVTVPPPTQSPKNGFYYLLDWNSFFDIDDQKGKRVNLRFQPHVGDPKRFLSVSVP